MASDTAVSRDVEFFRMVNRVVEPMVGRRVRTPLAATRIQGHIIVGTFRGGRSQWIRNLEAAPAARYWLAGCPREARAFVMHADKRFRVPKWLPASLQWVVRFLSPYTRAGWEFAVLAPRASARRSR
jgi:hypothetical protein